MDAAHDVPYVWVGGEAAARPDAGRALREWSLARGMRVVPAPAPSAPKAREVDVTAGVDIEAELDRARDAISALDAERADRALARAEAIARAHPEMPHAGWLLAEVLRGWSLRWSRLAPQSLERAVAAWQDAEALAGPREAGLGEIARPRPPEPVEVDVALEDPTAVTVDVDGARVRPGPLKLAAGPHHVVVQRGGVVVWASFVSVLVSGPLRLPTSFGGGGDCDTADLGHATFDGTSVRAGHVRCGEWVAVAPADRPGAILVATCSKDSCGPMLEWRTGAAALGGPPQVVTRARPWPAWATWALVGVGAATAACVTVVATGVLESRPTESRFVSGGSQVH